jgi:hypothetical protein
VSVTAIRALHAALYRRSVNVPSRDAEMTRLEHFDDEARRVVELAEDEAQLLGHVELGDDHLLLGVARVVGVLPMADAPNSLEN